MPTPSPTRTATTLEMPFACALEEVVAGRKVTRAEWASADCVFLHAGALHLRKADGSLHTLIVSEGDITATDWTVVREQ